MTSTREQLLGYLLGALETDEHAQVEQELHDNPALRHELEILRRRVEPLEWLEPKFDAPPVGLAAKTCDLVAAQPRGSRFQGTLSRMLQPPPAAQAEELPSQRPPVEPSESSQGDGSSGKQESMAIATTPPTSSWSAPDTFVLAAICFAAVVLIAPMMLSNVEMGRRLTCQNNLRTVGNSLVTFSDLSKENAFPAIPVDGPNSFIGFVTPTLNEHQLLPRPQALVCPTDNMTVPVVTIEQLRKGSAWDWDQVRRYALGSMGYNAGHVVDGEYMTPKNRHRSDYVLMAELPTAAGARHGRGFNVLYEDQHVGFLVDAGTPGGDDLFRNRLGEVAAGLGEQDSVIAPSPVSPMGKVRTVGFAP